MAIKKLTTAVSYISYLAFIILAFLASAGTMKAQGPAPQGQIEAAANAPLLISYQGRLSNASGPITATVAMTFTLWDAAAGGNVQWQEANKPISVNNGFFTTLLGGGTPLAPTIFDGRDLWIGVQVESDAEMSPRQRIASVPYAFASNTLVSGALISGTEASQPVLKVQNTSPTDNTIGMWGQIDGDPGSDPEANWAMGVGGYASSPTGHTFGVWGGNESSTQYAVGVLGNSWATTGQVWGVQGIIHSTTAGAAAVNGWVPATSGQTYAVMGESSSNGDGAAGVAGFS
jgi:hypothetical protein